MNIAALKHEMNSVNCQAQEGKQLFPDTHTRTHTHTVILIRKEKVNTQSLI